MFDNPCVGPWSGIPIDHAWDITWEKDTPSLVFDLSGITYGDCTYEFDVVNESNGLLASSDFTWT